MFINELMIHVSTILMIRYYIWYTILQCNHDMCHVPYTIPQDNHPHQHKTLTHSPQYEEPVINLYYIVIEYNTYELNIYVSAPSQGSTKLV